MSLLCSSTNSSSISFLSSFFSFFSQGWSAPGWSLWTQGGLWGRAGALNPTPSPPLTPCTLLQLPFFLCPGQEMDIIHSKEKKSTWKSTPNFSYTHVTGWNRDGFRDGWKTAPDMASSPQRGFCTKNPKAYKVIKNCASKVCFLFFVFFFCFAFKGSL